MKYYFIIFVIFLIFGICAFSIVAISMYQDVLKYPPHKELYTYYEYMHRAQDISVNQHYIPFIMSLILIPTGIVGLIFRKEIK